MTPEQAETLALASQQGSIQLALAQPARHDAGEDRRHPPERADGRVGRPARPAPGGVPRARPAGPRPQPSRTVVEVYQGGVRTLMRF